MPVRSLPALAIVAALERSFSCRRRDLQILRTPLAGSRVLKIDPLIANVQDADVIQHHISLADDVYLFPWRIFFQERLARSSRGQHAVAKKYHRQNRGRWRTGRLRPLVPKRFLDGTLFS